jgi:hypothetical protein
MITIIRCRLSDSGIFVSDNLCRSCYLALPIIERFYKVAMTHVPSVLPARHCGSDGPRAPPLSSVRWASPISDCGTQYGVSPAKSIVVCASRSAAEVDKLKPRAKVGAHTEYTRCWRRQNTPRGVRLYVPLSCKNGRKIYNLRAYTESRVNRRSMGHTAICIFRLVGVEYNYSCHSVLVDQRKKKVYTCLAPVRAHDFQSLNAHQIL